MKPRNGTFILPLGYCFQSFVSLLFSKGERKSPQRGVCFPPGKSPLWGLFRSPLVKKQRFLSPKG